MTTLYFDKAMDTLLEHDMVANRAAAFSKTREVAERRGISLHYEKGALDRFADEMCRSIFGLGLALDQPG